MAEKHYQEQRRHTEKYLIPYFETHCPDFSAMRVLEVGCAEAGFLAVLHERGMDVEGLEIEASRVELALSHHPDLKLTVGDITQPSALEGRREAFDLIVLRDVIEHIPDKSTALAHLSAMLKPDGRLFISFPPKFSGFSGHQQNGRSCLRFWPWLQLLPVPVIRFLGKIFGEWPHLIDAVVFNKKHALSLRRFRKLLKMHHLTPVVRELFLFRPVYQWRFGVKPRRIPDIPLFREVFAFGCEMLVRRNERPEQRNN